MLKSNLFWADSTVIVWLVGVHLFKPPQYDHFYTILWLDNKFKKQTKVKVFTAKTILTPLSVEL